MNNLAVIKHWDYLFSDIIAGLHRNDDFGLDDFFKLFKPCKNEKNVYQDLIYSLDPAQNIASTDNHKSVNAANMLCILNSYKRLFENMISSCKGEDSVVSLYPDMILRMFVDVAAVTHMLTEDDRFVGVNIKSVQVLRNLSATLALMISIYGYSRLYGVRDIPKKDP
jgi:hypothetical protein